MKRQTGIFTVLLSALTIMPCFAEPEPTALPELTATAAKPINTRPIPLLDVKPIQADDIEIKINTPTPSEEKPAPASTDEEKNDGTEETEEQSEKTEETNEQPEETEEQSEEQSEQESGGTPVKQDNKNSDTRTEDEKKQALDEKKKAYEDAKANEQSLANRTLTAATVAATGIGGMELARGLAEQKADKDADANMAAYIATFRCTYGSGKQVKASAEEIELPGGNNADLMNYRAEYLSLAADLKERKNALGMKAGIESEEILDKAQMGLYDDENIGITDGAYASLYRAKMLGSETDQSKIDDERSASKKRVIGGAVAAGVGVVGGTVGNMLINGELGKKLKEAIQAKKVGKETQALLKKEANALQDLQKCLKSAGVQETEKLTFENFYPSILSVKGINCSKDLATLNNGKKASELKASDLQLADSTDETQIYNGLAAVFGLETTGKMVGSTLTANSNKTDIDKAIAKIKTSIESVQAKFKAAEEKDKASAEKVGISLGDITGSSDGNGLSAMSSLFNGAGASSDGTSSGFDL